MRNKATGVRNTRTTNIDSQNTTIDFGQRTVSRQNFSHIVALPKDALKNCCVGNKQKVNVQLVEDKGERYIKLTPACQVEEDDSE